MLFLHVLSYKPHPYHHFVERRLTPSRDMTYLTCVVDTLPVKRYTTTWSKNYL